MADARPGEAENQLIQPISLVRRDDSLVLRLEFRNLKHGPGDTLEAADPARPACLIVHFPPQHLAETAFPDPPGDGPVLTAAPIPTRLSGPSRLVFEVPAGARLPYTLDALLHWEHASALRPSLVPATRGPDGIVEPAPEQTAIEAPYRLFLSPDPGTAWANPRRQAATSAAGQRHELWHTRLVGASAEAGGRETPTVRAVWSPDYGATGREAFDTPLRSHYAALIRRTHRRDLDPAPVPARHLMLSPMGAWLELDGPTSPAPGAVALQHWFQQTALGQDELVVTETKGYLLPTGHPAASVTVTRREFVRLGAAGAGGYLRVRHFIRVRQPTVDFGRDWRMPFRSIRILDRSTPALQVQESQEKFFWITLPPVDADQDRIDFRFRAQACDWAGNVCAFAFPAIFVRSDTENVAEAVAAYNEAGDERRVLDMAAQEVVVARPAPESDASLSTSQTPLSPTVVELLELRLESREREGRRQDGEASFVPVSAGLHVRLPALKGLLADHANRDWFDLHDVDAKDNTGGVFLKRPDTAAGEPMTLAFAGQGEKIGGLVLPDFSVAGVARRTGPFGDAAPLLGGAFNPKNYFADDARLVGSIPLWAALKAVPDGTLAALPAFHVNLNETAEGGAVRESSIRWSTTQLRSTTGDGGQTTDPNALVFLTRQDHPDRVPDPDQDTELQLQIHVYAPEGRADTPALTRISGSLTNYAQQIVLDLPGGAEAICTSFESITLETGTGIDPTLDPEVHGIELHGPLLGVIQFLLGVVSLGAKTKNKEKGRSFSITVSLLPDRIRVGLAYGQKAGKKPEPDKFAATRPPAPGDEPEPPRAPEDAIQWGSLLFYNVGISFDFTVFFFAKPVSFGIGLASPTKPFFISSVGSIWGGGGSLGITFDSRSLDTLTFSLQFGAVQQFKVLGSSVSVTATAGVVLTYEWSKDPDDVDGGGRLTFGYIIAIAGSVKLAEWLDVSLSVLVTLTPEPLDDRLDFIGSADVKLKVKICFFILSFAHTFRFHMRGPTLAGGRPRGALRYARGEAVPRFEDLMSLNDWRRYQAAFAR